MKTLVIGYGNTLRGDDGVGYLVAEAVADWHLPDVEAYPCHQLTPELAADMAEVERVIFVDATPPQNPHSPLILERLQPGGNSSCLAGHHSSPTGLLNLAQQLYGKPPLTYALLLPSQFMGFSEQLSPIAAQGLKQGLRRLQSWLS